MTPQDDVLLQDLLDGRLEPDQSDALQVRLAEEPALRERWEELLTVQQLVRQYAADAEPPAGFLTGVRARIAAASEPTPTASVAPAGRSRTPPGRPRLMRALTVAYAAAALLVVGFTVAYVAKGPASAPPPETEMARKDRDSERETPSDPSWAEEEHAEGLVRDHEAPPTAEQPAADGAAARAIPEAQGTLTKNAATSKTAPLSREEAADALRPAEENEAAGNGAKPGGAREGYFGTPGGAVHPRARKAPATPGPVGDSRRGGRRESAEPATPPPGASRTSPPAVSAPAAPTTPAPEASSKLAADADCGDDAGDRDTSGREVVFLLETRDAGAARKRLDEALARLLGERPKPAAAGKAGKPAEADKPRETATSADSPTSARPARSKSPPERLVRVPAAQAKLLALTFERRAGGFEKKVVEGRSRGPQLLLRDSVRRTLPPKIVERLEGLSLGPAPEDPGTAGSAPAKVADSRKDDEQADRKAAPVRVRILILEFTEPSK